MTRSRACIIKEKNAEYESENPNPVRKMFYRTGKLQNYFHPEQYKCTGIYTFSHYLSHDFYP